MKKILLILILGMFLFSFVPAAELTYEKDNPLNITITCNNGPSYCSSESVCNINVIDPIGKLIITNENMTNEISVHTYLMTPEETGYYRVSGLCADGSLGKPIEFTFFVNKLGEKIEKPESNFYFILIFAILLLFGIFFTIGILTPHENKKEMTDRGEAITGVTFGKYIKLFSLWIAYGLFLWFMAIINGMAINYIFFEALKKMIANLNLYLKMLGWGINIGMTYLLMWLTWKDIVLNKKVHRMGKVYLEEL